MKKIFIICSVRGVSDEYRKKLEDYVDNLEKEGCQVHLPHRDTNQTASGLEICTQNAAAIKDADEVHIFYSAASQGTHFDMGVAFANNKKIVVVEKEPYVIGKNFSRMLGDWEATHTVYDKKMENLVDNFRKYLDEISIEELDEMHKFITESEDIPKGWVSIEDNLPKWKAMDFVKGYSEYKVKYHDGVESTSAVSDHDMWYYLAKEKGITHWYNE